MSGHVGATISSAADQDRDDRALASVFSAYMMCATIWLVFATAIGVLLSLKFFYPDLATGPAFAFGRLRPIHTNDTFYGWASVALVGLAYYVAARSSRHPALQRKARLDRPDPVQRGRDSGHRRARSGI